MVIHETAVHYAGSVNIMTSLYYNKNIHQNGVWKLFYFNTCIVAAYNATHHTNFSIMALDRSIKR